jgi:hypothetical protein
VLRRALFKVLLVAHLVDLAEQRLALQQGPHRVRLRVVPRAQPKRLLPVLRVAHAISACCSEFR